MENNSKKVYIEDIDIKDVNDKKDNQEIKAFPLQPCKLALPMKASEHIFEIRQEEDKKSLIKYLENKDYLADEQLIKFIDDKAPELKEYFYQAPISIDEFKEQIRALFGDVPDYLFEGKNYLVVIIKIINHLIRKETVAFVIDGINSGKLLYEDTYYPIMYSLFYRIAKFNFHIESHYMVIELWETFLENHFWKIMFANQEEISIEEIMRIRQVYNFLGKQYTDFIEILSKQLKLLKQDTFWTKRTTLKPVPNYWLEVDLAKKNINIVVEEIKKQREALFSRKKNIEELLNKKRSIKKDQIETLFSGKWGFLKYKIKQWSGLFK